MVLIFNPNSNFTNFKLFDYLIYNKVEFVVIDPTDIFDIKIEQNSNNTLLRINNNVINFNNISCVFSTSSNLNLNINLTNACSTEFFEEDYVLYFNLEWRMLNKYLVYLLKKIPNLSIPYDDECKLITNEIARDCGFLIPNSIITTSSQEIKRFFTVENLNSFFCKRINNYLHGFTTANEFYHHVGKVFNTSDLDKFNETLFPSITQELINFEMEIRILFINNNLFSVAKFLNSNHAEIPYTLDDLEKQKIIALFKELKLNFGSIDLLKDHSGNYYFLEVNPHGQFDLIDVLGDINIYKIIFNFIYEKEKSHIRKC